MGRAIRSRRLGWWTTASALALCALGGTPALAQTQAGEADSTEVGELVVTGIRASVGQALEIKRNAEEVVDTITAVDIGALPDRSVSEALQRIPGVTLQRTNENRDPARLAAEGGGVFIRGLSWVKSEINGRDVFSANSGRGLSFEDVSADLLARVDVFKNPSADHIEGGIAGIVDLHTRKPFDSAEEIIAVSADYNYADLLDEGFFSANALYSNRWQTGIGELGLLLSASLGNIGNRTDSIQTGRFEARTNAAGETVYIPNSIGWRRIDWEQRRTAFAGALQWAPNDKLTITAEALYAQADPKSVEHALGDVQGNYPTDNPTYVFDGDGVLTAGTIFNSGIDANTRYGEDHKKTADFAININYVANDHWTFSGDVQYIKSTAEILSFTAFSQLGVMPWSGGRPNLSFDLSGNDPTVSLSDAALQRDQSAYWWAAAMDHLEDNEATEWAWRGDAEYRFDEGKFLKSFRFGVRGTDKNAITRQTGWNWGLLSQQFWGSGGGAPVFLDETGGSPLGPPNPALPGASELFTFDDFFRGNVNLPGVAWFPGVDLVQMGPQAAYELLRSTQTSGWGWTPLSGDFSSARPGGDNPNGGINDQTEKTYAAYGVLRFGSEEGFNGIPFDGNLGLRVVRTEVDAGLSTLYFNAPSQPPGACNAYNVANPGNPADCTFFNQAWALINSGGVGAPAEHSYTDWLPSLNIRFHLTEELQLRLAASRAIFRPTFSQMQPYTQLSFTFDANSPGGFEPTTTGSARTGVGGNPFLKPTSANQVDASLEWYFAPGGSLTFAAFYKDISNYIFLGNTIETFQGLGFDVTRNTNGSEGRVQGFEIGYSQFYDSLPGVFSGLGLQANFTYIDSSGGKNTAINVLEPAQQAGANATDLPLEGMSKTSFNIIGMYEKYGISARVAYNWRSRYLLTTSAANIQRPVWSDDYGQLDASVFYSVTPNVKVGIQGTNLLNSRTFLDVGGATLAPRYSWTDTDRRIAAAIRANF